MTPIPIGGGDSNAVVGEDAFTFASHIPGAPGEDGTVAVWGILDEPIPIEYFELFSVPKGMSSVRSPSAAFVEGHLVLWYTSGAEFHYTL